MDDAYGIRNMSVIVQVDHGKSILTYTIIAKVGIIAEHLHYYLFEDAKVFVKNNSIIIK